MQQQDLASYFILGTAERKVAEPGKKAGLLPKTLFKRWARLPSISKQKKSGQKLNIKV